MRPSAKREYTITWGVRKITLGRRTCIMGIVNVTPDSFSDGGLCINCDAAVAHGEKLVKNGADIIDIGGESTRPFSKGVTAEEESLRVIPVIEKLSKRISVPISIDTTKAVVARQAIKAGASIINDISALRFDDKMADVAAEYGVPVVLMHMKGTPQTMQAAPEYDDITAEIKDFFNKAIKKAEAKGVQRSRIIIDPGIGFGKTLEHNLVLLKNFSSFQSLDVPVLIGHSRKKFIRTILADKKNQDMNSDSPLVETGTQAVVAAVALQGAHIVRVHDVEKTLATIKTIDSILTVS